MIYRDIFSNAHCGFAEAAFNLSGKHESDSVQKDIGQADWIHNLDVAPIAIGTPATKIPRRPRATSRVLIPILCKSTLEIDGVVYLWYRLAHPAARR